MRNLHALFLAGAFSTLATSCSISIPAPTARVQRGPSYGQPPGRVLALPTVCLAKNVDICYEGIEQAVNAHTRMLLEFAGYRLLDGEMANIYVAPPATAEPVADADTILEPAAPAPVVEEPPVAPGPQVEVDESGRIMWNAVAVDRHNALLQRAGIESFMESTITIGAQKNMEGQRTVEVLLVVVRLSDLGLIWRSQCAVESGRFHTLDQAIERAVRCAAEGATLGTI